MTSEYKSYPVRIRVISQKGKCVMGHKVGDEWICSWQHKHPKMPEICDAALISMFSHFRVLWFGGIYPWPKKDPDVIKIACPDPGNPTVFELTRLRDQPIYYNYDADSMYG